MVSMNLFANRNTAVENKHMDTKREEVEDELEGQG